MEPSGPFSRQVRGASRVRENPLMQSHEDICEATRELTGGDRCKGKKEDDTGELGHFIFACESEKYSSNT